MNPAFLSLHEGLYVNPTHFHPLSIQEFWYNRRHANVAQSVEQTLRKRPVGGSIPFVGSCYLILQINKDFTEFSLHGLADGVPAIHGQDGAGNKLSLGRAHKDYRIGNVSG